VDNGFIGAWKNRTDIGDTLEYVQRLKDERRERRQARPWDTPHRDKEDSMATRKLTPEETHEAKVGDKEIADEDTWESPSSSPDKKILTGRALLESGLVECAVGLGVPLCTFNVRHFRAVAGLTTEQPYERE